MRSNQDWIQWGARDPLFGVAAWSGRERGGPRGWTDEDFYALGKSDWDDFITRWTNYGVDTSSCLEIGSGAGRLTRHMAKTFSQVHAVDVSAGMLEYARDHIEADNVTYHVTNGRDVPMMDNSVAAVFSTHVFQHFDSPLDGTRYFRELARVLTENGTLMIHLPMHSFPSDAGALSHGMRAVYFARRKAGDLIANCRRFSSAIIGSRPTMRALSYELGQVYGALQELRFTDVEMVLFSVRSNDHLHSFVLARKGSLTYPAPAL